MKRQIKFRGKRLDNGEWVYGAYFNMRHNDERDHVHHFIIPDNTDVSLGTPIEKIQVEVNPETVGQFIGLEDSAGKEIYEGDIIRLAGHGDKAICQIEWNHQIGAFCIRLSYEKKCGIKPLGSWILDGEKMIVIGNIHDNLDLLK